ncbi:MAG TPA: MEDS domain-containing protein [Vicinamibacterales bacterium]|jgi:signal transduction histidine kinase|nr:MEDS domain-containing protein [Vicinamibacterales bacterium]
MYGEIASTEVSRHKCLIYEGDPSNQLPVVLPLLIDGLSTNWRCLYLGSPQMVHLVDSTLKDFGVDTGSEAIRGALMLSSDRSHLVNGAFDPDSMIAGLCAQIDGAVHDGFEGLCATGDMKWELGAESNFSRLLEYEARLEQVFRDRPLRGICQYHRDVLPARAVRDALVTHRSTYIGDVLNRDNLFYIPPELLLHGPDDPGGVKQGEWMCQQIIRVLDAERARDKALTAVKQSEAHQRQLAEQLAEMNRTLEHRVAERTAELEAANKNLEAFSYSVSHDLRAPLRHIRGFASMLEQSASASLDQESHRYLKTISDAAGRMEQMTQDLLSFSRMGRTQPARSAVDLNQLVKEAQLEVVSDLEGRTVEWRVERLPIVDGDPSLLRLVFVNLLSNALKYSATRARAEITVGAYEENETETVVFVRDNGVGFDMTYADKLFGVFQRLHSADQFEGTGIGLANVRQIIQSHQGRTWAEARVDHGASFYFSLPKRTSARVITA